MKKSYINRISDKHKEEIALRAELKQSFIDEYGYICMTCHGQGDWRGISLSHKVPLSRGGKTDRANCLNECYPCHEKYEKKDWLRPKKEA